MKFFIFFVITLTENSAPNQPPMENEMNTPEELHSKGATSYQASPFSDLKVPANGYDLDKEFVHKFVLPFYMTLGEYQIPDKRILNYLNHIFPEITVEVISNLLGDFNWRTRKVGALFAAFKDQLQFQEQIGKLLLKSEVCYAGQDYCIAMATFNNQKSIDFLNQYLDYYLKQKGLYYDQGTAIGALAYLDQRNKTNELEKHKTEWAVFTEGKVNWHFESSVKDFQSKMEVFENVKNTLQHKT